MVFFFFFRPRCFGCGGALCLVKGTFFGQSCQEMWYGALCEATWRPVELQSDMGHI